MTLRKEGGDEPKARTYEVVWKKEVVDEANASSDGDEEGVRRYQELGRGDGKGETDASIPGGDHRANSYEVEEEGTFRTRHLLWMKSTQSGSQLLESLVVLVSLVGGDGEGEGGNSAISELRKVTLQVGGVSDPSREAEKEG